MVRGHMIDSLGSSRRSWMLEIESIHENHRVLEAEAMSKRWFDYRMLTPAQSTREFANAYKDEFREAYRRTIDAKSAYGVTPFSPSDIFESSDLTAMWLARQQADMLGCPYWFFIHYAFLRFADRGWRHLPRPNQLYGEELVLDIKDGWQNLLRDVLQFAKHTFYKEQAYVGHPDQISHHEWVVAQIKKKQHQHLALSRALRESLLPREIAIAEFGASIYERALIA